MKNDVVPVEIRAVLPMQNQQGYAIFVGNSEKAFVIQVEGGIGGIIQRYFAGIANERPLTHDLLAVILKGFGIAVERVIITELKGTTYYARVILQQQNELGRKLVELDARPSDCIAMALASKRPLYVSHKLFEQAEDMTPILDQMSDNSNETE